MSRQARQLLRESHTFTRVTGFGDAVRDLGTHLIHGVEVPYSAQAVYGVLDGRRTGAKLLRRIVERRPDLLLLSRVPDEVKARAATYGWSRALAQANGTSALGRGFEVEAGRDGPAVQG